VKDVRFLPIHLDEGDERWRPLEESAPHMVMTEFSDWPLDGVRSMRYVVKQLKRNHKSFMSSHSDWVQNSGVRGSDRVVHEHRGGLQWYGTYRLL